MKKPIAPRFLTRGLLAREGGVHGETIRFYEKKGLLAEPERTAAGYRHYPAEAVRRVRFIKRSQELGFTLAEIAELLKLRAKPKGRSGAVKRLAAKKLTVIDEKIADLQRIRAALGRLTAECDGVGPVSHCPILTAMEEQP